MYQYIQIIKESEWNRMLELDGTGAYECDLYLEEVVYNKPLLQMYRDHPMVRIFIKRSPGVTRHAFYNPRDKLYRFVHPPPSWKLPPLQHGMVYVYWEEEVFDPHKTF